MEKDPTENEKLAEGTESTEPAEIPESELEGAAGGKGFGGLATIARQGGRIFNHVGTAVTIASVVGSLWPQKPPPPQK